MAAACSNQQQAIEESAYGYLDAVANYRFDDAYPYSSKFTQERILPTFKMLFAHTDTAYINSNTPGTITIQAIHQVSSDTAYVLYHKDTPITHIDDSVMMIKEEGQWKAHIFARVPAPIQMYQNSVNDTTGKQRYRNIGRLTKTNKKTIPIKPAN